MKEYAPYRLLLYKEIQGAWHYVKITLSTDAQIRTETGRCGALPQSSTQSPCEGCTSEEALRREGRKWQEQGYAKANHRQMQVMTLHFQLPRWRGIAASAPWFEQWCEYYLDPILRQLDATSNGSLRSHEHISGNYLYYYMVFDAEAARQMVEMVDSTAPKKYPLEIYTGKREKKVNIPLDPSIPDYLRSILRSFEQTARLLSDHLPALLPEADPLQPESIPLLPQKRVRGAQSRHLQELLATHWHYGKQPWQPAREVPQAVWLDTIPASITAAVVQAIRSKGQAPCYLWENDYGLFEIEPEQLFTGAYEGIAFDASMKWVIYFSQHFSVTFCGEWMAPLAAAPANALS